MLQPIASRQLDLGIASFFRVEAESPPANQVTLVAGSFVRSGKSIIQNSSYPAGQASAGFSVVTAGFQRYDLVSIDASGAVVITPGYEVSLASPAFQGAPGWTGTNPGIDIPDGLIPMAYVLIDETASVEVADADITAISGIHTLTRDYEGHLVDKGLLGAAPTGTSDVVTTLFASDTRVSTAGGTEPNSGGSSTQTGFVTSAPLNYVHLVDQNGDGIKHNTGAQCYGRLTEAAGVWTLSYFYINAAGVETAMDPSTDADVAPTNARLVGTPRIFSRSDPNRPLFDSAVARLSDQIVGDIPVATATVQGKVRIITDGSTTAADGALGTTDQRVGAVRAADEGGGSLGYFNLLRFLGAGVTAADGGGGELDVTIPGATAAPTFVVNWGGADAGANVYMKAFARVDAGDAGAASSVQSQVRVPIACTVTNLAVSSTNGHDFEFRVNGSVIGGTRTAISGYTTFALSQAISAGDYLEIRSLGGSGANGGATYTAWMS